jgi:hypothetical protein
LPLFHQHRHENQKPILLKSRGWLVCLSSSGMLSAEAIENSRRMVYVYPMHGGKLFLIASSDI